MNSKYLCLLLSPILFTKNISSFPNYYIGFDGIYVIKNKIEDNIAAQAAVPPGGGNPAKPEIQPTRHITKTEPALSLYLGAKWNELYRMDVSIGYSAPVKTDIPTLTATFNNGNATITETGASTQLKHSTIYSMINLHYNISGYRYINPFLTFGIGVAHNTTYDHKSFDANKKLTNSLSKGTSNNVAWQVGIGITSHINPHIELDCGYRYVNFGKLETGTEKITVGPPPATTDSKDNIISYKNLKAHKIYIGFRYYI